MVAKKEADFDDDDQIAEPRSPLNFSISILGILFLILTETFFYILSEKTGEPYGIVQILFALILTAIITLFLIWIRWIMWGNKYAAIFISLLVTAGMVYALTRKYQGIYTTVFAVIGSVLFLGYIILEFWKLGKK